MSVQPRPTSRKQVLIVDDDHAALEAMGAALERELRIFLAPDLPTANGVLNHETVDLLILDVLMGAEDSLDFLNRLREKSDIPVLLISGYGTKEMVIAGMRSRASDYLDKPFTGSQLLDKARALIAERPRPNHIADRIRDFIQQHYARDWTMENLARELHLSVRTMRQMFRRRYRRSVPDFLEAVRLARARELLAATDFSIYEVATRVGFRDPQYFGRVFRRHFGLAPREYRAQQRHEPSEDLLDSA